MLGLLVILRLVDFVFLDLALGENLEGSGGVEFL